MSYQTIKIRKDTHHRLKVQAAERGETMMNLIDRLGQNDFTAATYRERKLIAQIQALISAHRYPHNYDVASVLADAEQLWKETNEELLRRENEARR